MKVFCKVFLLLLALAALPAIPHLTAQQTNFSWGAGVPESQGMSTPRLEEMWGALKQRGTTGLFVIRNDRVVFERYAETWNRAKPHGTASMAKALVGGMSLMLAMDDKRISPDDQASKFIPHWRDDPQKQKITVRHLATHTSGVEDAEADNLPHDKLTGWKGDFWKRLAPPADPFTIARDLAPVLDPPGTRARYSNPGMALLSYCITASLKGAPQNDLRSLLKARVMDPIGVPGGEWSVGYGGASAVEGMNLVATWGGGSYSANATARVGRLMLRKGDWNGKRLISPSVIEAATKHAGLPNYSGLGWWVNREAGGGRHWQAAPDDAFWGAGAGHQIVLVVPSLNLVVVRNGDSLDKNLSFDDGLEKWFIDPLMKCFLAKRTAPYPPSTVIKSIKWSPADAVVRRAEGGDNWPLTWADDDKLYTAYGDGNGFEPRTPEKLSMGFASISGAATDFVGVNIRSATGEGKGDGNVGRKASGMLAVDGLLYLWARNAGNAQLAWSTDHGRTWEWSDWKFTTSFGCPTFLNFGKNYSGARDNYAYIYSHDSDSAYTAADRMVLARVPKQNIRDRAAYEFFKGLGSDGNPVWTKNIAERGAVFTFPGNCYRSGISYNPGLKRYLWSQTLPGTDARFRGGFGVYDAPEPWGPWTTVFFTEEWDIGPGESSSFPAKWTSEDGRTVHLVFSGKDSFSVRRAELISQNTAKAPQRLSAQNEAFLEDLSRRSFRYFQEQSDPQTGLALDRARTDGSVHDENHRNTASIAATGFGLTALCIAADRGWIGKNEARDRVRNALTFFADRAHHEHGWFWHWMNWRTGERVWRSEISSIDTTLLLGGVLTARQYFAGNKEIVRLATKIYERVDFQWMLNGDPHLLSHGWHPETGFIKNRWDDYSEEALLYLLAIGSPTHPIPPESWYAWKRDWISYDGFRYLSAPAPLFIHQYSHAWVDFRGRRERQAPHVDYFENSVIATRAHRQFCLDLAKEVPAFSKSYTENIWGITASDSAKGYVAWGGPPRHPAIDGSVVPCAAGGSLMFTPDISLPALREMKQKFGEKIYGRYGFADAFNPSNGWVNPDVIGIDVGITLLSAENLRSGNVWRWFMRNPELERAMRLVGLMSIASTQRR
jgi:CubicO group peptidase (beta-lactamase class C family)